LGAGKFGKSEMPRFSGKKVSQQSNLSTVANPLPSYGATYSQLRKDTFPSLGAAISKWLVQAKVR
jgi:hypothetical protein